MMLLWIAASIYDLPAEHTLKRCETHNKGAACMQFMPPQRCGRLPGTDSMLQACNWCCAGASRCTAW